MSTHTHFLPSVAPGQARTPFGRTSPMSDVCVITNTASQCVCARSSELVNIMMQIKMEHNLENSLSLSLSLRWLTAVSESLFDWIPECIIALPRIPCPRLCYYYYYYYCSLPVQECCEFQLETSTHAHPIVLYNIKLFHFNLNISLSIHFGPGLLPAHWEVLTLRSTFLYWYSGGGCA